MKEFNIIKKVEFGHPYWSCNDESELYYIGTDKVLYPKDDYMKMREEPKWVDVTHELEIENGWIKCRGNILFSSTLCSGKYRVTLDWKNDFTCRKTLIVEMKQ